MRCSAEKVADGKCWGTNPDHQRQFGDSEEWVVSVGGSFLSGDRRRGAWKISCINTGRHSTETWGEFAFTSNISRRIMKVDKCSFREAIVGLGRKAGLFRRQ